MKKKALSIMLLKLVSVGLVNNKNVFNILHDECTREENQFEWTIYFKCYKSMSDKIQWKISKSCRMNFLELMNP